MYNKLIGKKKTLIEFSKEQNISIEEIDLSQIEECSNCSIWHLKKNLMADLDDNLICSICEKYYGL